MLRFAGLGLIEVIQERLFYREPFGNLEISILQVARSLLCHPEAAMSTVFGDLGSHCSGIEPPDSPPSEMVHVAFSKAHCTNSHPASRSEVFLPRWLQHYSLDAALADLSENVRIDPPLIEHPSYALLDVTQMRGSAASETEAERYNALPDELKQADLLRQLRNYLHDIYFSGEQESRLSMPTHKTEYKNSTYAGLDLDFIGQIQAANSGTGCVDPNWVVTRVEEAVTRFRKMVCIFGLIPLPIWRWVRPRDLLALDCPCVCPILLSLGSTTWRSAMVGNLPLIKFLFTSSSMSPWRGRSC